MANDLTPSTWAVSVLRRLNIQPTAGAVQALVGWARAEGGHWNNNARYNPLNTTQPEPGAGNTGTQGNIKVYKSWDQGIDATVQTLRSGRYGGIIAGLKSGDPRAVASAIDQSPWGTHGALIHNAISSAPAAVPHVPSSNPTGGTIRAPAGATTTTATPGVDNSGVRRSLIFDYLHSGGVKSAGATQTLASGWVNAQDVPGTTTTTPSTPSTRTAPAKTPTPSGPAGSEVLELIHNDGGKGYGIKDGQVVNGSQVFAGVWAGHADHVHVAAGPQTVVELGRLAQRMGLHVGENPHFGGVTPVHVQGSYHYKGEAIDVSGDPRKMNEFARAVEQYNRTRRLP
jgi:hypothetical protein